MENAKPIFNADVVRIWSEQCARYRRKTVWLWVVGPLVILGPMLALVVFGGEVLPYAFSGVAAGLLFVGLVISHYTPLLYCPHCGERPKYVLMNRFSNQYYASLLDVDYCRCCHYWLVRPPQPAAP